MKKVFSILLIIILLFQNLTYANKYINNIKYIYYRWQTCGHCANVEKYREKTNIDQTINIEKKEVQQNQKNANEMLERWNKLWIKSQELWTPFLVIIEDNWNTSYIIWDNPIIEYYQELEEHSNNQIQQEIDKQIITEITDWIYENNNQQEILEKNEEFNENNKNLWEDTNNLKNNINENEKIKIKERLKFFAIMMPAAVSDSINPCAFAVMLLLLTAILSKTKNKTKALLSWLSFSAAVFITYFLLWIWVFKLLWNLESLYTLKRIVWIIWILVWLANLKDYFRYWEGFVMEVPHSWRPKMEKIIKKVTSPFGAFIIWIIISLFLLPCSSGPYLTILWYLSSESQNLNIRWYVYLTVYNIIFVLPMIAIALIIGLWYSTAEKIWAFKNKNTKLIHGIVGLLMIWLWIYVIWTLYRR